MCFPFWRDGARDQQRGEWVGEVGRELRPEEGGGGKMRANFRVSGLGELAEPTAVAAFALIARPNGGTYWARRPPAPPSLGFPPTSPPNLQHLLHPPPNSFHPHRHLSRYSPPAGHG